MYLRTCAPSEDSDQSVRSHSIIRVFAANFLHSQAFKETDSNFNSLQKKVKLMMRACVRACVCVCDRERERERENFKRLCSHPHLSATCENVSSGFPISETAQNSS